MISHWVLVDRECRPLAVYIQCVALATEIRVTLNKVALTISLICILLGTTVSILGIWGYIGDTGLVWRSLSTLGVVLLGVVLAVVINNMTQLKDNEPLNKS